MLARVDEWIRDEEAFGLPVDELTETLFAQFENHFDIPVIEEGKSFIRENAVPLICSRNVRPEGMEFVGRLKEAQVESRLVCPF